VQETCEDGCEYGTHTLTPTPGEVPSLGKSFCLAKQQSLAKSKTRYFERADHYLNE